MPYRKYYSMRRRYNAFTAMKYKRRRQGITKYSLMLAKKALKSTNRMNKARELKFLDLSGNSVDIDELGIGVTLNDSTKGTTQTTRVGNKIYNSSIQIRGSFFLNGLTSTTIRFIIIRDKPNITGVANVLQNYGGTTFSVPISPYVRDNKLDYKVIYDKTYYMSNVKALLVGFKIKKKLKFLTQYDDTDTIQHNSIKLLAYSAIASGAGTKPKIFYTSRIYFTDD